MNGYSYSKDRRTGALLRELEIECPCGDGYLTMHISDERKVLGVVTFGCSKNCEQNYSNGVYDGAIQAAISEADRIEANGPTEAQLQSIYDTAGPSDADSLQRMADARAMKQ